MVYNCFCYSFVAHDHDMICIGGLGQFLMLQNDPSDLLNGTVRQVVVSISGSSGVKWGFLHPDGQCVLSDHPEQFDPELSHAMARTLRSNVTGESMVNAQSHKAFAWY